MDQLKHPDLFAEAIARYNFRARGANESAAAYRVALIEYLDARDWALAHEVRIDKRQAEWTADDAAAFTRRLEAMPRSDHEPGAGVHAFPVLSSEGHPVTTDALLKLATDGLDRVVKRRHDKPVESIPIIVSVLLTTGQCITTITDSDDRIATVKLLARAAPVFGYFLVFDAFVHTVDLKTGKARKRDAILEHIGTRDLRLMKQRPYTLDGRGATFDNPPPADLDKRGVEVEHDPYASIFVTSDAPSGVM